MCYAIINKMRGDKLFVFLAVLLALNLVSAGVSFGNESHEFGMNYAPGESLSGWVNVSFDDEDEKSLVSAFEGNVSIAELFSLNDIDCSSSDQCSCFPLDCRPGYSTLGSSSESETYSLSLFGTRLFGIKIEGNVSQITSFGFNVSTDAGSSCFKPLMIDLLDDDEVEWVSEEKGEEVCFIENPYGCFNEADVVDQVVVTSAPFCEKIVLPPMKYFRVGTKLNGTGDATFHMTLNAEGVEGTCRIPIIANGGAKSCDIELDETLGDYIEADVCLFADESNTNLYNVSVEDVDVCGYNEDNGQIFHHDFEIYARPLKYKEVEDFRFDSNIFEVETNLSGMVWDYVDDKYNGDCDPECIIPIKIYSGILQNLRIDDSRLGYKANGLEQDPIVDFYSLDEISASISSEFMKLVIDDAEFSVPNEVGKHDLEFRIGGAGIDDEVNVKSVPTIVRVFPTRPALLVPTKFVAVMEGLVENESYQYIWDFGDGSSSKISLENVMEYTYSAKDSYTITLNVTSEFGDVSRSFPVSVVTPYDAINDTIGKYKGDLDKVESSLNLIPSWIQDEILEINDIDSLRGAVDRLEKKYKETLKDEDEELIKIMNDLVVLKIPNDLRVGQSINKAAFVQSKERFDVNALGELGAGDVQESEEKYYDSVNAWVRQNVDITLESSTYFLYYESGSSEVLVSHIKLVMTPTRDVEEFFMILEGNPSDIVLMDDYREKDLDFGYGLRFPELLSGESKNVEFLIPSVVEILNPPVYVSPEYRNLEFSFEAGVCNNNNICDANAGETYKNCRADCKPWTLTLVFLFVLVIVTLIIYIVLQEWYKKGYERHLFKNKNQLFNLMAFMRNAQNSGMKKGDVFEKLRPFKWSKEQLNYSWNRLHGKRTGMWEIPIFRSFEKKKIKKEMARRGVPGVVGGLASRNIVSRPVGVGVVKEKKKGFFKGLFRKKDRVRK